MTPASYTVRFVALDRGEVVLDYPDCGWERAFRLARLFRTECYFYFDRNDS